MPFVVSASNRERLLAAENPPFDEPVLSDRSSFDTLRTNGVEGLRANEGTYVPVITSTSTKDRASFPLNLVARAVQLVRYFGAWSNRRSASSHPPTGTRRSP